MEDIDQLLGRLGQAGDLPELLTASWQAFELSRRLAGTAAGMSADLYPAFTFARGAAVSGRNELAAALSTPPAADGPPVRAPRCDDARHAADILTRLASALASCLRTAADLASDAADRQACQNAARYASEMHSLLTAGPQADAASAAGPR
jgi:hypothetical protein